ncbi:HD family phosphohydrolase [Clostridia bacterium]|nr:HD family phosphohydrolase [Clostridia bacterium]GHU76158.1 HD family phosphohydrolase [Clostridia bacterium]
MGHYLCKQKQNMKSNAGKTYLSLKIADKTNTIDGKVWELDNDIQNFEEGDYIKIDAIVIEYRDNLQLKIMKIRKSVEGEYEPSDYIPCTDKNILEMYAELCDIIDTILNPHLHQLLTELIVNNPEISAPLKDHSAAKTMHHSYSGGLLEHTLSVVQICDFLGGKYKYVNRDLLLASAILHDIGKVYELLPFPVNDYSDIGKLLGHSYICCEMINKIVPNIEGFPEELRMLLTHCVLSHHGEYEYGAPKRPKIIEAFILHCADDADAKIKAFESALSVPNTQGDWIGYDKCLNRYLRKTNV